MSDSAWQQWLTSEAGARLEGDSIADFGDPDGERAAVAAGEAVRADLGHRVLVQASGGDVIPFLQGQTTNDVAPAEESGVPVWGAHLTPKGRMVAALLTFPLETGYGIDLAAEGADYALRRLGMYVLNSDVHLERAGGEVVRLGVAGADAAARAAAAVDAPEADAERVVSGPRGTAVPLPGPEPAFLVVTDAEQAAAAWEAADGRPVGRSAWELARIRAGVPDPDAAVCEMLLPQEANLEPLGAISYSKGCYTGQEVVARTHHLGRLKRRLYRFRAPQAVPLGQKLQAADGSAQGPVTDAAPDAEGGWQLLAVARIETVEAGTALYAGEEGEVGPLSPLELPYTAD
jgi:hypothetical protein